MSNHATASMQSTTWSPMVSGPDDDFSNFLEFSDLQLDFPPFDASPHNGPEIHDSPGPSMDLHTNNNPSGFLAFHPGVMQQFGGPSALPDFTAASQVFPDIPDMNMPSQLYEQQQLQHQLSQHPAYGPSYNGHHMVPPTPNSIEIHGGLPQYQHMVSNNHARAMYEHHRRHPKGQTTFTPLVSPAVTPHDAQFQYKDYPVASEFFSPLTSPALEAQNHKSQRSVYGAVRGSDTSDTTSPIDMNADPSLQPSVASAARKPRRRTSSTAQRNPQRAVRQSPSMKPQSKKKHLSSSSIPPKRVSGIIEDAENAKHSSHSIQQTRRKGPMTLSQDSSEAESISPEPLSEVLMPPPATPKSASASKSPQIIAATSRSQSSPMLATDNKPATPASLMRIRKAAGRPAGSALKEQTSMLEAQLDQTMEAIVLPETTKASSKRPALTPLRTSDAHDDETTPTMSARKTPKIAATSAPATATGHVSAETSALLLAAKSNYQNIVEGTHLPGVSYPETLSTNLTSKRTSHKLAEQGRRNRINTALQEIAALLPPTPNGPTPKDGMNGLTNGKVTSPGASVMLTGTAAQQSNSKASTVELAIDYIKTLQGELQDVKAKLELAEQKLAEAEKTEVIPDEKKIVADGKEVVADGTKTTIDGDGDGADGNDDG
ncbi:MAG: hypothetical protein Q9178_003287 [Gyalolechia marmorata]